ncbi:uncharacterized protein BXZ73DRAFT_95500 [Epithele typhae]|uniref:uncharacterized protein n=1 Tax=Epithele typhae TaxID=378194 RepID=UPI0020072768|nr:uncharacterized protein BXZ73DRAFT_95500 [Epithele typhae]KAH9945988.1 hypothetical protein BXZ73DRAFT_95500 [Epithele typhae]
MVSPLSVCRYVAFALFTLCNAVICCVLYGISSLRKNWTCIVRVSLPAFGILYIFPVMYIDLLRKNALVSRVWFEATWVGVFWVLNLVGALLTTMQLPRLLCNFATDLLIPGSCLTTRVIQIAGWAGVANLLVYFIILMVFASFTLRQSLNSPVQPTMRTTWSNPSASTPQIRVHNEKPSRVGTLRSAALKSSALRSAAMGSSTMKSSNLRSTTFDSEKMTASPAPPLSAARSARSANKSARILQSSWISSTVTPASPHSDEYGSGSDSSGSGSGSDRSDLTSTPTGIPPSAMYVPFTSTIKPSPLGSGVPPRSASLASFNGQPPMSALTPSRKGMPLPVVPSPKVPLSRQSSNSSTSSTGSNGSRKSKRKSNRPPPLDMTRLHSTYGR